LARVDRLRADRLGRRVGWVGGSVGWARVGWVGRLVGLGRLKDRSGAPRGPATLGSTEQASSWTVVELG
jgi:hypothetical protein